MLLIWSVENEATPALAATDTVPPSVPLDAFVPMAIPMVAVDDVTVLPSASVTATCTAGDIAVAGEVFDGWTLNTSFDAAPGLTVNVALVVPDSPVAVATSV